MADDTGISSHPSRLAAGAGEEAGDDAGADKAYARNAVNETGRKIMRFEDRAAEWHAACSKRIAADPVKSVLLAAAGGALLAGLLLAFDRSGRRWP